MEKYKLVFKNSFFKLLTISVLIFLLIPNLSKSQSKLETVIQKGHSAAVKSLAVSSDGKYLITGSRDRTTKLWDLNSGVEMRTFNGHEATITALCFSPDNQLIATVGNDQNLNIYLVKNGKNIFKTKSLDKRLTSVAFSPDGKHLVAGGYSDTALVFDTKDWKIVAKIPVNADQGSGYGIHITFSKDGQSLSIGEDNRTLKVYSTKDWTLKNTFAPKEGWCGGCGTKSDYSLNNQYLVKMSHHDSLRVYDLKSGNTLAISSFETNQIAGINFSTNHQLIYIFANEKMMIWDWQKNIIINEIENIKSNQGLVCQDSIVVIANDDLEAYRYDVKNKNIIVSYSGYNKQLALNDLYNPEDYWNAGIAKYLKLKNPLLISKDGKKFWMGKNGKNFSAWNLATGEPQNNLVAGNQVICLDFNKKGNLILAGSVGNVQLWDIQKNVLLKTFKTGREPVFSVQFSPDEKLFVCSSWDAYLLVFDIESGQILSETDLNNASSYNTVFTPDGLYTICGKLDKTLEMREPDSKQVVKTFIGHTDIISSIHFGTNPHHMLTASWDGSIRIWDLTNGLMIKKFKGHIGSVHTAIYSLDGTKIYSAGDDQLIRIWDVESGQLIKTLKGHQSQITTLDLNHNANLLLSYSLDGVVKCWDLQKEVEFYEHIHLSENDWMVKTTDGYFSATDGARKMIHFVKDMDVYSPDQFFDTYYRPDLLPQLYKERGIEKNGTGMDDQLNKWPVPYARLYCEVNNDGINAILHIKIMDEGGGVIGIKLSHNGKVIPLDISKIPFPKGKGKFIIYDYPIELVSGKNTFSVCGTNKLKIESRPYQSEVYTAKATHKAICHIIAIGVDEYKNPQLNLKFAVNDAQGFTEVIAAKTNSLYYKTNVYLLKNQLASKRSILDTLDKIIANASSHDVFIFYYAGHGSMIDQQFYFITSECTHLYSDADKALNANVLQEKFKQIKALKQIIIMDACQSGGSVETLAMRGAVEEKAIAQLSRSAGIHILASAGSDQYAKELSSLKHGLFTYVLLEGMQGKADGAPNDGKITVYELKSFLDDKVPQMNEEIGGKLQFPYTFSRGQDFPILTTGE